MPFIRLGKLISTSGLLSFYHKCWILSNSVSVPIETYSFFFILSVWMTLIIETALHSLDEPHIIFMCCWIQLAKILLMNFASLFMRDISSLHMNCIYVHEVF